MEKYEFLGIINAKSTGPIFNKHLCLVVTVNIESRELLIGIGYITLAYDRLIEVEQLKTTLNIPDLAIITNFKSFKGEILKKVCEQFGFMDMELQ